MNLHVLAPTLYTVLKLKPHFMGSSYISSIVVLYYVNYGFLLINAIYRRLIGYLMYHLAYI